MTRPDDEHTDDSSIPIRIPVKFVAAAFGVVLFGSMGVNTALFKSTPSSEYADLARIVTVFGEQVGAYGKRVDSADAKIETLRIDLLKRTTSRFTQDDAENFAREQDRKHAALEQADAQAQRAIAALEREVDELRKGR